MDLALAAINVTGDRRRSPYAAPATVGFKRVPAVRVSDTQVAYPVRSSGLILGQNVQKSLLDDRAQGAARGFGMALRACQQFIMNINCGLHRPILPMF